MTRSRTATGRSTAKKRSDDSTDPLYVWNDEAAERRLKKRSHMLKVQLANTFEEIPDVDGRWTIIPGTPDPWVFAWESEPGISAWQIRDGSFVAVARGASEMGLPADFKVERVFAYENETTGSPELFIVEPGSGINGTTGGRACLVRMEAGKFVSSPIPEEKGVSWQSSMAFDSERGVLVNFGERGRTTNRISDLVISELVDGQWRDALVLDETSERRASEGCIAYVPALGKIVVGYGMAPKREDLLDEDLTEWHLATWDGKALVELPRPVFMDNRGRGTLKHICASPSAEHTLFLVVAPKPYSTELHALASGSYSLVPGIGLAVSATIDQKNGRIVSKSQYAPSAAVEWRGPGTEVVPMVPPVWYQPLRSSSEAVLQPLDGGTVRFIHPNGLVKSVAVTSTRDRTFVGKNGGCISIDETTDDMTIIDENGERPFGGTSEAKLTPKFDLFAYDDRTETLHALSKSGTGKKTACHHSTYKDGKWASKDASPPVSDFSGAMVATASGLVAVRAKKEKPFEPTTWLFDGAEWSAHPLEIVGFKPPKDATRGGLLLLAYDSVSARAFMVLAQHDKPGVIAVHDGDGKWSLVGELPFGPSTKYPQDRFNFFLSLSFAYRACDRTLVVWGNTNSGTATRAFRELPLGTMFDALGAPKEADAGVVSKKTAASKPGSSSYYLRFRDEESNKFWIGKVEGSSYAVQWGKRSTKGQAKSFECKSEDAARAELAKKAQEKINDGYERVAEGEHAARTGQCVIHPIELAEEKPAAGEDVYLGDGYGKLRAPSCKSCGKKMSMFACIHRDPKRTPWKRLHAVAAFLCDETTCHGDDPNGGDNLVVCVTDPSDLDGGPSEGALSIRYEASTTEDERAPDAEEWDEDARWSKLGGYAQGPHSPPGECTCDVCGSKMALLVQLEQAGWNFGDGGCGYVFLCPEECSGKFTFQAG